MSVEEYIEILNIMFNKKNREYFIKIMGLLDNYAEAGYALDLNNDIIMSDYIAKDAVTDPNSKLFSKTTELLNYQLLNYQLFEEIIEDIKREFSLSDFSRFNVVYQNYEEKLLDQESLKSDSDKEFLTKNAYVFMAQYVVLMEGKIEKVVNSIIEAYENNKYCYDAQMFSENFLIVFLILGNLFKDLKRKNYLNINVAYNKLKVIDILGNHMVTGKLDIIALRGYIKSKCLTKKEEKEIMQYILHYLISEEEKTKVNQTFKWAGEYVRSKKVKEY